MVQVVPKARIINGTPLCERLRGAGGGEQPPAVVSRFTP
jgi:hypothetical protein